MDKPEIAAKEPIVLELEPGDYWYCTCGRSKGQPWCDGAHSGTSFTPEKFTVAEKKKFALCQCKATGKNPCCDGAHTEL